MTEPSRRPAGQWTPAELGVHQAIGGPMPAYVRRPLDEQLRAVLNPATEDSRLVVIRGDALTGKSRAACEAISDLLADWPLEYPPTAAALAARIEAGIPARTVLWLGELRHYADADGGAAVLDRLDGLLEEDGYLVITTIWPEYWDTYTAAAGAGLGAADPAAVVGRLLARLDELALYDPDSHDPAFGGVVDVPARFTAEEMTAAADAGDPVLAAAVVSAGPDGQVTQYLAGAHDLLARYDEPGADPYGHAVITAAMDATRLGHASALPAVLLRDAALGYLPDPRQTGGQDTALDFDWALPAARDGAAGYRLVGYLDQHGRRTRGDRLGPASLWDALAAHTSSVSDLGRLAEAARDRGLHRHAAALWTAAAAAGRTDAAIHLITHLGAVAEPAAAGRTDAARWAVGQASLDDPWDVAGLVRALRTASDALPDLLARDPVGQVSLARRWDVAELVRALRAAGAAEPARALAVRAAGQAKLDNARYVAWLLQALRETGAAEELHELASRVAEDARLEDMGMGDVAQLLQGLHAAGAADEIRTLADRAVGHVSEEDPHDVAWLLNALRAVGADGAARVLLARDPASHVSLEPTRCVAELLAALHAAGAADAAGILAGRAAAHASLDDAEYAAQLLNALRAAGAGAEAAVQTLLARDPAAHASVMFPEDVAQLLEALHAAGAETAIGVLAARVVEQDFYYLWHIPELTRALRTAGATDVLRALSSRAAAEVPIDDPETVAGLLEELRHTGAGAETAVQTLLDRDPAGRVSLDDAWEVARLLGALRAAGAGDAVRALATRAAHGVSLDDLGDVARLLEALDAAGAVGESRALADRAAHDASLHDPQGVARLLEELRRTGAGTAVQTLLARDPARQVAIDASQPFRPGHQRAVARLLTALREAGAAEAVRALAVRAADAGMFALFLEFRPDQAAAYRFGREPDGTPSPPWIWSQPPGWRH